MIRSTLSSWREYLTPVTHTSSFRTTGEITPEEFVEAGDYLVYKFPTWQWSSAPESKRKEFLPHDKQFLITTHVPSYARAAKYLGADVDDDEIEEEDGWTTTHKNHGAPKHSEATKEDTENKAAEEEINDIDDLIESDAEGEYVEAFQQIESDKNTRQYDLYIAYSTSYRVPKMYLVGFNSNGIPLTPPQMFEDISVDYRDKTATIEKAPFLTDTTSVSIHPCRHATVMKVLMNRAMIARKNKKQSMKKLADEVSKLGLKDSDKIEIDDEWEEVTGENDEEDVLRVDQYLIIFLKFIASVTPGIEHDYTMDAF